ncbi:hypothetical protein NJBCHELONAE_39400 [Mycobacteroides chelonae]|uniref:hypothetical protein n=1 Tax=Mycobacteroides chelonae TaxID=1774 RepID=UPI0021DEF03A|nr:hypothetical protein [Mycobacteroides chelonae]GLE58630.1 hypothetical protein NJBCHELONAE_39400 [Mycobacteroides chelonae]
MSDLVALGDEPGPRMSSVEQIRRGLSSGLAVVAAEGQRCLEAAADVLNGMARTAQEGAALVAALFDPLPSQAADRASEGKAPASDGTTTGAGLQD